MKEKNKSVGLHQDKTLFCFKGHHQKSERQPTVQEKISTNHISDKKLVLRILQQVSQLNNQRNKNRQMI